MKQSLILDQVKQRMGIDALNPMQQKMCDATAHAIILLAPTGSGKTLAFTIPMLKWLKPAGMGVQAVVIAPSRELVMQIAEVVRPLAVGYKTVAFYGGHPMQEEVNSLAVVPDIVVATPGRLLDHLKRHTLSLDSVRTLVLDEYDKSLELGFEDEMKRVVRTMTSLSHVVLTSATVMDQLPEWLPLKQSPIIEDFTETTAAPRRRMDVVEVESPVRDKLDTLVDLLRGIGGGKSIIFVNHRESADRVFQRLKSEGLPAGLYHGGLDQPVRENALEMFNNGTTPVLISTDLGARGLDIDHVDNVIHYHMPATPESWTHRNGRTARQQASGTVWVITAEGDNIPEWVTTDRRYRPTGRDDGKMVSNTATLYFNIGKKEKISRGDIAGFLIAKGGLKPDEVGRIALRDHSALVAVPARGVKQLLERLAPERIKAKRARISRLG